MFGIAVLSASWIEFNNCPTRCDLFSLLHFCRQLYMFRMLTPIIRSSYNCNYSFCYWLTGHSTIHSRCWVGSDSCVSYGRYARGLPILMPSNTTASSYVGVNTEECIPLDGGCNLTSLVCGHLELRRDLSLVLHVCQVPIHYVCPLVIIYHSLLATVCIWAYVGQVVTSRTSTPLKLWENGRHL